MRIFGTPPIDYLMTAGLGLFTALYLWIGYGYPVDARAFPLNVAWVMVCLLILDLVARTATRSGRAVTRWLNPAAEAEDVEVAPRGQLRRQIAATLWLAGFVGLLGAVGILGAVPIYICLTMRFRAGCGYLTSLIAGLGACFVVWLMFSVILRVPLYPGILFAGW